MVEFDSGEPVRSAGWLEQDAQPPRLLRQGFVQRPQARSSQHRRCKKMDIDPSEAASVQPPRLDQRQHLVMIGLGDPGKRGEQRQDLVAAPEVPTGKFPNDERVGLDFSVL